MVAVYDYSEFLKAYAAKTNSDGVYPVDEDLYNFLQLLAAKGQMITHAASSSKLNVFWKLYIVTSVLEVVVKETLYKPAAAFVPQSCEFLYVPSSYHDNYKYAIDYKRTFDDSEYVDGNDETMKYVVLGSDTLTLDLKKDVNTYFSVLPRRRHAQPLPLRCNRLPRIFRSFAFRAICSRLL